MIECFTCVLDFPELTVSAGGDILRAQILSDVLNLYFSHPAVEGVLLWGFWDGEIHKKDAALFTGPNVTVITCRYIFRVVYPSGHMTS